MHNLTVMIWCFTLLSFCCTNEKTSIPKAKDKKGAKGISRSNHYIIWKSVANPTNHHYQDYVVYLSSGSLKIFNGASLICSGEIIKEKKAFSSYFKSIKTGSAIKTQLQENFKIPTADSVLSISICTGI